MKHLFPLLLTLMLCGCAPGSPSPEPPEQLPPVLAHAVTYPVSSLEESTGRALQVFPLGSDRVRQLHCTDTGPLLVLETDTGLRLERFAENGSCSIPVPGLRSGSVQIWKNGVSYFDEETGEIHLLDAPLREQSRIRVPGDLVGIPLLTEDQQNLYYCTETALRKLELSTGISRMVKEIAFPAQSVSGLVMRDSVLALTVSDSATHTLFLRPDSGQLLQECSGKADLYASGSRYYASVSGSSGQLLLSGTEGDLPQMLLPKRSGAAFLSGAGAAIFSHGNSSDTTMEYYSLDSGLRTAELTVPQKLEALSCVVSGDGVLWFTAFSPEFGCQALYRWASSHSPVSDTQVYTADYSAGNQPDTEGLSRCADRARTLGERYGLEIRIDRDTLAEIPEQYRAEPEQQAALLSRELDKLDAQLNALPDGFLKVLRGCYSSLNICIVESIGDSSTCPAGAVSFLDGTDAFLLLSAGETTPGSLYHPLCHLMESVVLTHSTAYDRWDTLQSDTTPLLSPGEDRALLFEYAMTEGNAGYFASSMMQTKLAQLCLGIREAFGLKNCDSPLPWEQYLVVLDDRQ